MRTGFETSFRGSLTSEEAATDIAVDAADDGRSRLLELESGRSSEPAGAVEEPNEGPPDHGSAVERTACLGPRLTKNVPRPPATKANVATRT